MAETTITTDDYEVTADTPLAAVKAIWALEAEQTQGQSECETPPEQPVATLGDEEITARDLVESWERKAKNYTLGRDVRAAYCDAAEKLDAVLDEGSLTERP